MFHLFSSKTGKVLGLAVLLVLTGVPGLANAQTLLSREATDVYQDPNYSLPPIDDIYGPSPAPQLFCKQPRTSFLQSVRHSTTLLSAAEGELSLQEYDFSATGALPFPTIDSPLIVTPFFGWDNLDPDALDVPDELYEATIEFRHLRPVTDRLTADMAIKPGYFGDFESGVSNFRLQGKLAGIWEQSPTTKWVLGATYLDRDDIDLLPIAGVIWRPSDYWKVDLVFPAPKIAVRAFHDCHSAWWLYTAGEFGGGSWGFERLNGTRDTVTLRDIRLRIGMEREAQYVSLLLEAGYVFGRELEYSSGIGNTDLDGAALVRAGIYY